MNHIQKGITAVMPGRRERSLGLAVDMGTTTVAAYLCDLQNGQVLSAAESVNPQRRYGEDVIEGRQRFLRQTATSSIRRFKL